MKTALLLALAVTSCGRAEFTPGARGPYSDMQPAPREFRGALAVGPDGRLIAPGMTEARGTLTVVDVVTRTTHATSIPVPDAAALSSGLVYTVHTSAIAADYHRPTHVSIAATDVATAKLVWRTASGSVVADAPRLVLSPDGARLAVIGARAFVILDARTGERLATVAVDSPSGFSPFGFPTEAGLAVQTKASLSIHGWNDGASTCTVQLPMATDRPAGAPVPVSPTRLAIRLGFSTAIVDLSACSVETVLPGVLDGVFGGTLFTRIDPSELSVLPNSPGLTRQWDLLAFDVATRTRKTISIAALEYPHHAIAPDGRHAIVRSAQSREQPLRVLDIASGELRAVAESTGLGLVPLAFSIDSANAFVLAGTRLGSIELATAKVRFVRLAAPDSRNYSRIAVVPQTGMLLVEDRAKGAIDMFDPVSLMRVATLGHPSRRSFTP